MTAPSSPCIERVQPAEEHTLLPDLIALLRDATESGGSIGFLPPLSTETAGVYWRKVFAEMAQDTCTLLVAREAGQVAGREAGQVLGAVQLALVMWPNAPHRAEVRKLLVLTSHRRRGIGRALMDAVERAADAAGRTLLVLDTRQGDAAERLYRALDYQEVGVVPGWCRDTHGAPDSTVIFYKHLPPAAPLTKTPPPA
jgi:ribosomal protein S18 acetylase RimI-like enzyme